VKNTNETSKALAENNAATRDIVVGATALMDEVIAAMRRRAAELRKQRRRRERAAMPPPVASMLHGFTRALADKIDAISARLSNEVRERLSAIGPGFVRATVANDPDVVQLFAMLLAATPDEAAHWLIEQVDLLEERFAS
jgi:hypothetical protein